MCKNMEHFVNISSINARKFRKLVSRFDDKEERNSLSEVSNSALLQTGYSHSASLSCMSSVVFPLYVHVRVCVCMRWMHTCMFLKRLERDIGYPSLSSSTLVLWDRVSNLNLEQASASNPPSVPHSAGVQVCMATPSFLMGVLEYELGFSCLSSKRCYPLSRLSRPYLIVLNEGFSCPLQD